LRDAQRVQGSEEIAATKPLGRDILVSKRACSSHFRRALEWRPSVNDGGCAGEDIARVLAHVIQVTTAPRNAGFVAQATLRLRPRSVARCIAPSFCSDGSPTSLFASMS